MKWVKSFWDGRLRQMAFEFLFLKIKCSHPAGEISATKTNVAVQLSMNGDARFYRLIRIR